MRSQIRTQRPNHGLCGRVGRHNRKAFTQRSFLAHRNLENFNRSRESANSRCHSGCEIISEMPTRVSVFASVRVHILREVSACLLVQLRWAVPGPLCAERAKSTVLALFLYHHLMPTSGPEGNNLSYEKNIITYFGSHVFMLQCTSL